MTANTLRKPDNAAVIHETNQCVGKLSDAGLSHGCTTSPITRNNRRPHHVMGSSVDAAVRGSAAMQHNQTLNTSPSFYVATRGLFKLKTKNKCSLQVI